jgi:hypothetical protein
MQCERHRERSRQLSTEAEKKKKGESSGYSDEGEDK